MNRVIGLSLGHRGTEKALKLLCELGQLCGVHWLKGVLCCSAGCTEGQVSSPPSQIPGFAADESLVEQSKPHNYCHMCSQQGSGFLFKIQSLQEHIGVLKLNQ